MQNVESKVIRRVGEPLTNERPYEAPEVVKHGGVVELTLGTEEKKAEKFAVFDGFVTW